MNVILISIDSLRGDAVSCYGSDWVRTPNLDMLARDRVSLFGIMEDGRRQYTYSETLIRENHKVCLRSPRVKLI